MRNQNPPSARPIPLTRCFFYFLWRVKRSSAVAPAPRIVGFAHSPYLTSGAGHPPSRPQRPIAPDAPAALRSPSAPLPQGVGYAVYKVLPPGSAVPIPLQTSPSLGHGGLHADPQNPAQSQLVYTISQNLQMQGLAAAAAAAGQPYMQALPQRHVALQQQHFQNHFPEQQIQAQIPSFAFSQPRQAIRPWHPSIDGSASNISSPGSATFVSAHTGAQQEEQFSDGVSPDLAAHFSMSTLDEASGDLTFRAGSMPQGKVRSTMYRAPTDGTIFGSPIPATAGPGSGPTSVCSSTTSIGQYPGSSNSTFAVDSLTERLAEQIGLLLQTSSAQETQHAPSFWDPPPRARSFVIPPTSQPIDPLPRTWSTPQLSSPAVASATLFTTQPRSVAFARPLQAQPPQPRPHMRQHSLPIGLEEAFAMQQQGLLSSEQLMGLFVWDQQHISTDLRASAGATVRGEEQNTDYGWGELAGNETAGTEIEGQIAPKTWESFGNAAHGEDNSMATEETIQPDGAEQELAGRSSFTDLEAESNELQKAESVSMDLRPRRGKRSTDMLELSDEEEENDEVDEEPEPSDEDVSSEDSSPRPRRKSNGRKMTGVSPTNRRNTKKSSDSSSLVCDHCGKGFTRRFNLLAHLRSHMQIKPFKCDQCSLAFCRKHDLKRHQRLHSGELPYVCESCGKRFQRIESYARHRKVSCSEE